MRKLHALFLSVRASRVRRSGRRCSPTIDGLEDRALLSTLTVTNTNDSGPGSLRDTIANSASGDTIDFAPGVHGTIDLTSGPLLLFNESLTIQGPGAGTLTISGDDSSMIFFIFGDDTPSTAFNLSGLTLAHGYASNAGGFSTAGGAVFSLGAPMSISQCVFSDNTADVQGGAIFTISTLSISDSTFNHNVAGTPAYNASVVEGGAINCFGASTTITNSTFTNNVSHGSGGAIAAEKSFVVFGAATLSISNSTFSANQASASGSVLSGLGGALFTGNAVSLQADNTRFLANQAVGRTEASGGAIWQSAGSLIFPIVPIASTISNSTFVNNVATAVDGSQGAAEGGAINCIGGLLNLDNDLLSGNKAIGSSNPLGGGLAQGGAVLIQVGNLNVTSSAFVNNQALSGSAVQGTGGFALGGGIAMFLVPFPNSPSTITDSVFSANRAVAGAGTNASIAAGGAVWNNSNQLTITHSSFLANAVVGSRGLNGGNGGVARGGAVANQTDATHPLTIVGGLFLGNQAVGGQGGESASHGGNGGEADGGAIANLAGSMNVTASTLTLNAAIGGDGGRGVIGGNGGAAFGGGLFASAGAVLVTDSLITLNFALGGEGGDGTTTDGSDGQGLGGGVAIVGGSVSLHSSTVKHNHASTASNDVYGTPSP